MKKQQITLKVNGKDRELLVKPNDLLLNVLRDTLGLMGTKYGCGLGECGACTVLLNGKSVLSCLILAVSVDGQEITTVEGLGNFANLNPLQKSFIDHGAVQCGFCTSGIIMTAKALLEKNSKPTEEEVREALSGNYCRCGTHFTAVDAIMAHVNGEEAAV